MELGYIIGNASLIGNANLQFYQLGDRTICRSVPMKFTFKNNKPKYILLDIESNPIIEMTDDEKIDFVAARILKKYRPAFEELAK